jgi:TATA-binding protein-associated factor
MEICNLQWLEDLALRLLCVFALDRFGDYLSDEVVAPVREMCAQTLGVVLKHMVKLQVQAVLNVLLILQAQEQWQVRYSGLLGAKYLLAVRQDMTAETLPLLLNSVKQGLDDPVDDVRAVAAMCLLPVTDSLITFMPHELSSLLSLLWDTLADLDELTASTNGVMSLLASLYSSPNVLKLTASHTSGPYSLSHVVPRLWPFLSHTIISVRQATVRTLFSLLSCSPEGKTNESGSWISEILHEMLRQIYQRLVLEPRVDLRETILEVWIKLTQSSDIQVLDKSVSISLRTWLSLAIYPANTVIDSSLLTSSKHSSALQERAMSRSQALPSTGDSELKLGGISNTEDSEAILIRLSCARALGELALRLSEIGSSSSSQQQLVEFLSSMLSINSNSAMQRLVTALIVTEWATNQKPCLVPDELHKLLVICLDQSPMYSEVATLFGKLQTDCQNLLTAFLDKGVNLLPQFSPGNFSVDSASSLVTSVYQSAIQALNPGDIQAIRQNKLRLSVTVNKLQTMLQRHHIRVQAALATAVVAHGSLPAKLNPVIRPLMESIKREENETLQKRSAHYLAQLLGLCRSRTPCPNDKIVKNLCTLLCANPNVTPHVADPVPIATVPASPAGTPTTPITPDREVMGLSAQRSRSPEPLATKMGRGSSFDSEQTIQCGKFTGIVTLVKRRQAAVIAAASHGRRASSLSSKKHQQRLCLPEITVQQITNEDDHAQQLLMAQCRGAKAALLGISRFFSDQLPVTQPKLWSIAVTAVQTYASTGIDKQEDDSQVQDVVHSLQVLEMIASAIDKSLQPQVLDLMPQLCAFLQHPYSAIRHMAARCIAAMTSLSVVNAMEAVIAIALPLLNHSDCVVNRQGAMETIAILVDELGMEVLPYVVLLVVPLLGRMSDQEEDVRLLATQSFASLVKLMPLEVGVPDPPGMADSLSKQRLVERRFLEQLLDPKMLDNYAMTVAIKSDLRKYQQDGVNWLGFLNKYKLHGILCDDMGLGKTLQTICIIAGDHDKLKNCKVSVIDLMKNVVLTAGEQCHVILYDLGRKQKAQNNQLCH